MKLNISETLKLPIEAVTQTFAILAKRGVGKTYTGCVMIEEMLSAGQQVVVADPIGVWWGLRSSADGKNPGFPIVVFGGEHADVPLEEHSGEIIAQAVVENGFSAILDISLLRKAAQVRFMTAFAETLYRLNRKPLHFCVDEADAFAPQRPMENERRLLGSFEDIVRRGRARGLGVTLITQRAAVINKNVLTQIEVLVVLRTISPQDREAIEAWTEVHGTEEQLKQLSESIASLPIGTAWFWSPGWLNIFKRVEVRKRITFDSSSTPKVGEKILQPKSVAEIDLSALGDQIKSAATRAKENDPSHLKVEISRLKKELSKHQIDTTPSKQIEIPVLVDTELHHIKLAISEIREAGKSFEKILEISGTILAEVSKFSVLTGKNKNHWTLPARPEIPQRIRITEVVPRRNGDTHYSKSHLGKCERSLLAVLAQYPQGRTTNQMAILSGYSVNSGGFNNSLSNLRSRSLITRGSPVQITDEGIKELGQFDPLPTGADLANYWYSKLGKCEREILKVLVNSYPEGKMSSEISEATGYSQNSGGFNNSLSKLRTLELVTRGQPIKANENLFE